MSDYTLATKCPHCGGRLMLSEFMSYSRDSLIRKNGQPCKRWSKSPEGSMDAIAVSCMECGTVWDDDHATFGYEGVYIRGDGERTAM